MFRTGVPHFGVSGRPTAMNESALIRGGDILKVYEEGINRWQIAQVVDAANAAVGDALYWKSKAAGTVTPTIGNSSSGELAGFAEVIATAANYYIALRQGGLFSCKANGLFARGTPVMADSGNNRAVPNGTRARVPLVAATTNAAGGVLTWQNPYSHALRITRLAIERTTKSTGAATGNFGVAATVASANNLLTALDMAAAESTDDNFSAPGVSGLTGGNVGVGEYVTGTASATVAGLVGFAYIEFIHRAAVTPSQSLGIAQGAINAGKVSVLLDIIPA